MKSIGGGSTLATWLSLANLIVLFSNSIDGIAASDAAWFRHSIHSRLTAARTTTTTTIARTFVNDADRVSSFRGGAASPSNTAASSAVSTVMEDVPTAVANMAISAYLVVSETATQKVLPVLRDPYRKVWIPTARFLQEQEEAAIDRRLKKRQQQQHQAKEEEQREPALLPSSHMQQQLHFHEPSVPSVRLTAFTTNRADPSPLPSFLVSKKKNRHSKNDNRDDTVQQSSSKASNKKSTSPSSSLGLLFVPTRLFKLSLAAWLLAEMLDHIGILHEEMPAILRSQWHHVWYDLQPRLATFRARLQSTWHRVAPEGLQGIPTKYQFAMGAGVGMIASPLLLSSTAMLWQPAVVVYGLSELYTRLKASGHWNLELIFNESVAGHIDRWFDRVRHSVRNVFPITIHLPSSPPTRPLLLTGGSKTRNQRGYPSSVSRSNRSRADNSWLSIFFWKKYRSPSPSSTLITARGSFMNLRDGSDYDREKQHQQHRMMEMLRHGFLLGGVLGLLGGF